MAKYIDAEKLKYEIERRKLSNYYTDTDDYEAELFEIIGSLQQEQQEEPVSKDLEEAAKKHSCYDEDCEGAWYEPIVRNAFIAGADWQKEQMLKEAVEGTVHNFSSYKPHPTVLVDARGFNQGDKVRVIVCKKED